MEHGSGTFEQNLIRAANVAGLFAGAGYIVRLNFKYGDGRPDVVIKEMKNRRALLLEVKHAGKDVTLEHAWERCHFQGPPPWRHISGRNTECQNLLSSLIRRTGMIFCYDLELRFEEKL